MNVRKRLCPPLIRSSALDPLRDLWPSLLSRIKLPAPQSWEVSYKGDNVWAFEVHADPLIPKSTLAAWFQGMSGAFSKEEVKSEAKDAEAFLETWEPKTLEDMKQLEQESRRMRLPKNAAEQAELEGLASQGLFAVYGWIYGPNSLTARQVNGQTWEELGMGDPVTSTRLLVDQMRKIKEADGG